MATYRGEKDKRGNCRVLRDGKPFSAAPSLRLRNHSPDGFAWGYRGSGPAQLALALLLAEVGRDKALLYYQRFKDDVVAHWSLDEPWACGSDLMHGWVKRAKVRYPPERG